MTKSTVFYDSIGVGKTGYNYKRLRMRRNDE